MSRCAAPVALAPAMAPPAAEWGEYDGRRGWTAGRHNYIVAVALQIYMLSDGCLPTVRHDAQARANASSTRST